MDAMKDPSAQAGDPLAWSARSFACDVERRAGGVLLLRPRTPLKMAAQRLTDRLEYWAARAPERVLIAERSPSGAWQALHYAQALRQVRRVAAGLSRLGLSAQRPVLILSGNGTEHLLLALAAMYIGVPYCPVSPGYSRPGADLARLRHVVQRLTPGLCAAFGPVSFADGLEALMPADALRLGSGFAVGTAAALSLDALAEGDGAADGEPAAAAHARVTADSIAKFLLTSGSTGRPKAVITTHRMLCANQAMLHSVIPFVSEEPPVLLDWLPWHHTFGGSHNVGLALYNGGSLYLDEGRPLPGAFEPTLRNLRDVSPTVYLGVPAAYEMLAAAMDQDPQLRECFYRRLRACFFAAASLAQHTWDAMDRHALAARGRRVAILSGLGATETAPSVTFTTPETERAGVIGLPAPGCLVKLFPVRDKLELRTRGPHVMPGYWRDPEQTAAAFDSEGFYCLGDAVRLMDASDPTRGLVFDGRLTEDFKLTTGTWVSVGPLRAALLGALTPLALDVVIAGAGREYPALLVVPDVAACQRAIGRDAPLSRAQLAIHPMLLAQLAERLACHARRQLGVSTCVRRAAILAEPPSADRGEITDKGSLNQQRMLERWSSLVEKLCWEEPPAHIVRVDGEPLATG